MKNLTISQILSEFTYDISYDKLPDKVVYHTKEFIIDILASMIAATQLQSGKIAIETGIDLAGKPEATLLGYKEKIGVANAAMANAIQGYSFDFIDDQNESKSHPSAASIPAALAMAESLDLSGKKLIEAIAAGNETVCRTGAAFMGHLYDQGFHPSAVCGVFGSAMSAGKLMNLSQEQLTNTQGLAGCMSSGMMVVCKSDNWGKRLHAGHAAHSGIIAAQMASRGFKGPKDIYEGDSGFYYCHAPKREYDLNEITKDLGRRWLYSESSIKPYPCCRFAGATVDACLLIKEKYNPDLDKIKKITILTQEAQKWLQTEPREIKWNPKTQPDAQFSMPFQAAISLARGKAGIDEFSDEACQDEVAKKLIKLVEVVVDPELEKLYPEHYSGKVCVEMQDGKKYIEYVEDPKGDWRNPVSHEEIIAKFVDLSSRVIKDESVVKEIIKIIENLEDLKSVSYLMKLINS